MADIVARLRRSVAPYRAAGLTVLTEGGDAKTANVGLYRVGLDIVGGAPNVSEISAKQLAVRLERTTFGARIRRAP